MNLSQQIEDVDAVDLADDHPLQRLYPKVVQEFHETSTIKTGARYFSKLWASLAPCGNIYRHLALDAECRLHSWDLQRQLLEVAEQHKELLGGDDVSAAERAKVLLDLLKQAEVIYRSKGFEKAPPKGFPPLEEFLCVQVRRMGWLLCPQDRGRCQSWLGTCLVAWCIWVVQMIAPASVLVNRWDMNTNHIKDPVKAYEGLTLTELTCLGDTLIDKSTTVIGTLLLFLVTAMVRSYAVQERDETRKSGLLPVHGFWMCAGFLANSCACVLLCLALPFLFWSEDNVTDLVLDSVSLTFLFSIDDLSGGLCCGLEDSEAFQRSCAWQAVLLSQCPVRVADLINPDATRAEDLWQITIDDGGSLVVADGASPVAKKGERCETRLHYTSSRRQGADEEAPLLDAQKKLTYRTGLRTPALLVPTRSTQLVMAWWGLMTSGLFYFQVVVAPLYFVFNQPCYLKPAALPVA